MRYHHAPPPSDYSNSKKSNDASTHSRSEKVKDGQGSHGVQAAADQQAPEKEEWWRNSHAGIISRLVLDVHKGKEIEGFRKRK
jgi:hypothetical protein